MRPLWLVCLVLVGCSGSSLSGSSAKKSGTSAPGDGTSSGPGSGTNGNGGTGTNGTDSASATAGGASGTAGGTAGGSGTAGGTAGTAGTGTGTGWASDAALSPSQAVIADDGEVNLTVGAYAMVFSNSVMTTAGAGEGAATVSIDGQGCNADSIYATAASKNVYANAFCLEKLPAGKHQVPATHASQQVSSTVTGNGSSLLIADSAANILAANTCTTNCGSETVNPAVPALLISYVHTRVENSADAIGVEVTVDGFPCTRAGFGSSGVSGQSYDTAGVCAVSLTAGSHSVEFKGLADSGSVPFDTGYLVIPQSRVGYFKDLKDDAKTGTITQTFTADADGTALVTGNLVAGAVETVEISVDGTLCGADTELFTAPVIGTSASCIVALKKGDHTVTITGTQGEQSMSGEIIVWPTET